jgi:hypothetical protein
VPHKKELAAADKEESEAAIAFAAALSKKTSAEVEITAARKRLMNARGAKLALYYDMMCEGPQIKSLVSTKV